MKFELEKLRIEQLVKAYSDSSVGKDPRKRGIPCHDLENVPVFGHESPSSEDLHEQETENPSLVTEVLVELLSTESDPITSATVNRAVAPDAKFGFDTEERNRQMIQKSKFLGCGREHTHLVNGLDYDLEQNCAIKTITKKERRKSYRAYF
ncbi:hypothetical protein NPIL_501971 [Nephila pilipes]|uniref:RED-like N-terminal domain-containing protein n=1 Tax=Nephila pilipes TaxID=299642 RepID=A0A8X6NWR2_NEPPI|nr:hypothetical protein NPIL_501971 [Nephila pilipes]